MAGFRDLPSVDVLLRTVIGLPVADSVTRARLTAATRQALAAARAGIATGQPVPTTDQLIARIHTIVIGERTPALRPVINATGVILQTNLGRAPLSAAALTAVALVASGYSNLEYDLDQGARGSRQAGISQLIAAVTGAATGIAVNNNAAAVLLALAGLAGGREVIVSRGQLIEIGGGFRVPDVLRQSGAHLVEVGTTNRTYARDFAAAINPNTAALLRVHPSNFVQRGFTHEPALGELADLAQTRGIFCIDDLGSGALLDTATVGLAHEPTVLESIKAGVDLVCFSGDKLLGGPQAGLIAGNVDLVDTLARHPLARAVRLDKLSLAALEATLRHYVLGDATDTVPVWRMLRQSPENLASQAAVWVARLTEAGVPATTRPGVSTVGGGAAPEETLPTTLVALAAPKVEAFARRLRSGTPAIIGRMHQGSLLLDPRTVAAQDHEGLLHRLVAAWQEG